MNRNRSKTRMVLIVPLKDVIFSKHFLKERKKINYNKTPEADYPD